MTEICLSKALAIIDSKRGPLLKVKRQLEKDESDHYHMLSCKDQLRLLNSLKKEFANLSNSDQIPLGL